MKASTFSLRVVLVLAALLIGGCGKQASRGPEVSVKRVEGLTVAYVSHQGSYDAIPSALQEVMGWIQQKGIQVAGPPMGVFYNEPGKVAPEKLLWEIQWPIAPREGEGVEEKVKQTKPMEVAYTIHRGPHDQVGAAFDRLKKWIGENGYQICGPAREIWFNDPHSVPPESLKTEVQFPVVKKGANQ